MKHEPPRYAVSAPHGEGGGCYNSLAEAMAEFGRLVENGEREVELLDYVTEPPKIIKQHECFREEWPSVMDAAETPFADNH